VEPEPVPERDPELDNVVALAPAGVRPPSWWKGDRAAFASNVKAQEQMSKLP
jgi:hypothetical protein